MNSAKILKPITWLFHPLLIPMLASLLIFSSGHYLQFIDTQIIRLILLIVFTLSIVLPALIIPLFYLQAIIPDLKMQTKKSRIIALTITLSAYVLGLILMQRYAFPIIIINLFYALILNLILLIAAQFFIKLNFHAAAWGSIIGLIIFLSVFFGLEMRGLLTITLLISGITGSILLILKTCKPKELYPAYLLGIFGMMISMFAFYAI
ncbi:MAG: hypothetical protein PF448_05915 [Bacteroidales bacterium]|jgi:hypothetical protein|nr:hypothetical protein [Bacteroidales bacterium]